jgi:four helix bundle protein
MTTAKSFQDLLVWQKSHQFVVDVYRISAKLPKEEVYGLTSQIRRAAMSIPANIAEGFKRKSNKDKARFYNIAEGSLEENRYFLILAKDLNFVETNELQENIDEIAKMLNSYITRLKS